MDIVAILLTVLVVIVLVLAIGYIAGKMNLDPEAQRILMLVVGGVAIVYLILMMVGTVPALTYPGRIR